MDFVIEEDGQIVPVEVKINSSGKIERSLQTFIQTYKPRRAFIVSYKGKQGVKNFDNTKIFTTNIINLVKSLRG